MRRTRIPAVLSLTLALMAALPAGAAEREVVPAPGALATAIAEARAGDVLRLAPGTHDGPVLIDKPLTLDGNGKAIVKGPGTGSVITVDAPETIVAGLTATGSGLSHETIDAGIKLTRNARGARIVGNRILDNLVGVDVRGASDAVVTDNLIEGRRDLRLNERGNGIYAWNASGLIAERNTIRYGRDGVFVNASHNNAFRHNLFEEVRFAVHYMYGNQGQITGNVSIGNDVGYALMFSNRLTVTDNASLGDRNHGLMLNYANSATISGNLVRGGGEKCLFMYNANKNAVEGNRFEGCPIGIHFTAGSEQNAFSGNAFVGNKTQVKYVGSRNLEWSKDGRGNFWSDHAAFDTDGNGIADAVYRPNDMIDQILWTQPAAKLLIGSPAVQLLRWTQTQFPALLPGGIVDSAPLMHAPAPTPSSAGAKE
ncbi:nitrous oxide reductase family maturation protein NosD [Polymorphum gilvum]|uniref:NosD nitrous oxidase accessory protein n=1 Tax=Polymorphum gilvum (strain LMG 25793 / CGMCC 1.9160 / SL003B-26A1) TaxID=991905 RepID=F2J4Q4_POLGS|nr:nitrous oxide reductase family maturation protein NosD [Polymorphum gilvum]ADZ68996.1 NosD nitrous oxidase accessory protein [Polymorphum gilvum SL003B-26A1]